MLAQVNFISVILASIIVYLLGWFWYSPKVFGKVWMKGLGYRRDEIDMQWYHFLAGFLTIFVTAWVFAGIMQTFMLTDLSEGVELGFWIWLGFVATALFNGFLYQKMTFTVYLVNAGYQLVSLLFLGGFLIYWR